MPNFGSSRCEGCGGEDCVCCEVYQESVADARAVYEPRDMDDEDDMLYFMGVFDDEEEEEEEYTGRSYVRGEQISYE